jgi:nucleoside-diphosphate-sugar epimerase
MDDNTISILGCGWLGKPIAVKFIEMGFNVKGSTTTSSKIDELQYSGIEPYLININNTNSKIESFLNSKYLIVAIPSKSVSDFINLINEIEASSIQNVIYISSTSVYKKSNKVITEGDIKDLIESPLLKIEKLFLDGSSFETTILRFAGLFGYNRNPGNFFKSGKKLSDPEAFVNLIHLDDCLNIIEQIIEKNIWNDIFNCCTDSHPTKREFYTKVSKEIGNSPPEIEKNIVCDYKIISNEKLKKRLNYKFKYNNLLKINFSD